MAALVCTMCVYTTGPSARSLLGGEDFALREEKTAEPPAGEVQLRDNNKQGAIIEAMRAQVDEHGKDLAQGLETDVAAGAPTDVPTDARVATEDAEHTEVELSEVGDGEPQLSSSKKWWRRRRFVMPKLPPPPPPPPYINWVGLLHLSTDITLAGNVLK
jgi:hypothetical protein